MNDYEAVKEYLSQQGEEGASVEIHARQIVRALPARIRVQGTVRPLPANDARSNLVSERKSKEGVNE